MVSSKSVIAKVIADLDLKEEDIKITDIKQWIGDACMNIGSVNQLEHKVVVLPLNSYQCKLPCDLERLNSVAYSTCDCGGWIPMKKTTGTFSVYDKKKCCNDCEMIVHDNAMFPLVKNMFNLVTDEQALEKLSVKENEVSKLNDDINEDLEKIFEDVSVIPNLKRDEEYKKLFKSHWDEEQVIVKKGDEYWVYIPMDDYFYSGNYLQINYCPECGRKLTEELEALKENHKQVEAKAVQKYAERAKRRLPVISPSVFDQIANEILEGEE